MDADGSHNPKDIPAIYKKFEKGYDLVIGSRYTKGGKSNDRKLSFLMSKLLNMTMRNRCKGKGYFYKFSII